MSVLGEKWRWLSRLLYLQPMSSRRQGVWLCFAFLGVACGGGSEPVPVAADESATSGNEATEVSANADAELAALPAPTEPPAQPLPDPRQGDVISGGAIARADLNAVIQAGIPTFLQRVRTEPHTDGRRFVGWRLVSIFNDPAFALGPIRIGDVVLGVNGRTIERPEQFFAVWETLASASEITFQVLRADQAYEVRYAIVD